MVEEKYNLGINFDLMLIDYSMPEMDGCEFLSNIERLFFKYNLKGLKRPYTVCLTAYNDKLFESRALKAGFDSFETKPICNSKLLQIINDKFI